MVLEVGKPFPGSIPKTEGNYITIDESGLMILLCYNNPSSEEISDIKNGEITVALTVLKSVIFFLIKFGPQPWNDMPFSYLLSPGFDLEKIEDPTSGYAATICLIDISNSIVKSIKLLGLPNRFSKELYNAVQRQKESPYIIQQYDRDLAAIYESYSTNDLLKYAVIKQKCKPAP